MTGTQCVKQVWCGLTATLIAASCYGQESDWSQRFTVNGYGYAAYTRADGNTYLGADTRGTWSNNFFALVLAGDLTDRLKLWTQLETGTHDSPRTTWAFLDYQFSPDISIHAGRVKQPLGLYNETIDATLTRPSTLAPSMYQRAADFVLDAYNGIGVDYHQSSAIGQIVWQGYYGNTQDSNPQDGQFDHRIAGGRITLNTPLDGLRCMVSGARTLVLDVDASPTGVQSAMVAENVVILSGDYAGDAVNLTTEFGQHTFDGLRSRAWYMQAAYELNDQWRPYLRYDSVQVDTGTQDNPTNFQRSSLAGIGYAIRPRIVLRGEWVANHGYALPVLSGDAIAGTGKTNWTMLMASVNFAF